MELAIDDRGLLPEGIHDASLSALRELFGGFQKSDCRLKLIARLEEFIEELRNAGIAKELIVDGSFVMGCIDEPEDIDLILVLPDNWDMEAELKPFQYNLLSKRSVKRRFPFDLFSVRADSTERQKWIDLFSKVNVKWFEEHGFAAGDRKGLVRIEL